MFVKIVEESAVNWCLCRVLWPSGKTEPVILNPTLIIGKILSKSNDLCPPNKVSRERGNQKRTFGLSTISPLCSYKARVSWSISPNTKPSHPTPTPTPISPFTV